MQIELQEYLNIKATTLIAGLLGAFVTFLRKSEGSLQARISGFVIAIATILYLVPFLLLFVQWKFGIVPDRAAENLLSFVCGMLSQRLTENFVDDPAGSVYRWAANVRSLKRVFWNDGAENLQVTPKGENEEK